MLSILGTNFIAHWAYEERISAHAQLAVKCEQFLHVQSMLSMRRTKVIAHWAYAEQISSHAEQTRNRFHRMLSMRGNVWKLNISAESNTIFKNLVLQARGTIWFRFLQKSQTKKFHACVPLRKGYILHVAMEMDTPCMSLLMLVERNTPCTSIDSCWWCNSNSCHMILENHM